MRCSACGHWLPAFDLALLQAGEHSGRLEACFRLLTDYYTDRARLARQMIGDLAYPAFLFHFAVFIFPFAEVVSCRQLAGVSGPDFRRADADLRRCGADDLRGAEPARRDLAGVVRDAAAPRPGAGHGAALPGAVAAGRRAGGAPQRGRDDYGGVGDGGDGERFAGPAPDSAGVAATGGCRPDTRRGGQRLAADFPRLFANQYATGEISGQLDDTLRRLHGYYEEEGSRKLHAVAQWTPRAVYLFVVLLIAYQILHFYLGYFGQIRDAGGW